MDRFRGVPANNLQCKRLKLAQPDLVSKLRSYEIQATPSNSSRGEPDTECEVPSVGIPQASLTALESAVKKVALAVPGNHFGSCPGFEQEFQMNILGSPLEGEDFISFWP